MGPCPLPEIK